MAILVESKWIYKMQLLKVTIIFFLFTFSSFTHSTNLVDTVSEVPLKVFHNILPTFTQGQYIEYNEKLLTIRLYDNQGLHEEFSVELSGHSNNNSAFKAFVDTATNSIWVTDSHFDSEANEYYLTVEQYLFDDNGFTGDHQKINFPPGLLGDVQGFNNSHMYIIIQDVLDGSWVYNFTEYDLSSEISLKRSLAFDENFGSRISPNGSFFVTSNGIISLVAAEMVWIDSGLNSYGTPLFIDDETIIFRDWDVGYFIGSISENTVLTSLILPNNSSKLQYETQGYTYHKLESHQVINFYDSNDGLINSFSIDKRNNSWQISDIELGTDINDYSDQYKRTLEGGLINRNWFFSYNEGKWLQNEQLVKGFELDKGYVFVSNMEDAQEKDLYAIFIGDVNRLRKLELVNNTDYQWRDIAEIPKQAGEVKFASKYQNNIYIFSDYWDGTSTTSDAFSTSAIVLNLNGEQLTTIEVPFIGSANFVANIYNEHIYLTSPWGALKCTVQAFDCDDITPSTTLNGWPHYFNNYIYYYSFSENKLVYYNTKLGANWNMSTFELPDSSSRNFEKFGNQLRFDDHLLTFNDSGEIDSLETIISVNSDHIGLYSSNDFYNGRVSCDDRLVNCVYIEGQYTLKFTSINSDTWNRYKKIKGTLYFYDPFEEFHSLEVFRTKDDLIFPEIKEIMPKEIEIWQNDILKISLNDYFKNIYYYEQESHSGWPDYYDEYKANNDGDLQVTLTNEHTWFEPTIPFATYTGANDNFTIPIYPMSIIVRDINEPPELIAGASLTLTANKEESIQINFDKIFWDPERTSLQYIITTLPLPLGLAFEYGELQGALTKAGTYNVNVTVKDTSLDELSSDFTIKIHIKDENGNVPSAEDKPSSSGGVLGGYLLLLCTLLFSLRRRLG